MRRVLFITLLLAVHTCSEDSDQERAKRTSQDQPPHDNDNVTAYLAAQDEDRNYPHSVDAKVVNEVNAFPAIQSPKEGVKQTGLMAQQVFNTFAYDEKDRSSALRGHLSGSKGPARVLKEPEPVAADRETSDHTTVSRLSAQPPDIETPDHTTVSRLSAQPPDRETPDHTTVSRLSAQPPDIETPGHISGSRLSAQPPDRETPDLISGSRLSAQPPDIETPDHITGSRLSAQPPDRETPDHISGSRLLSQPPDRETPDHITGSRLSAQPPDRETPDHITGSRLSAQPPDRETPDHITVSRLSAQPPDRETPDHITGSRLSAQPPDRETPDHITGSRLSAQPPDTETPDHITGSRLSAQQSGDSVEPAHNHALYRRADPLEAYYNATNCLCPECKRPWKDSRRMARVVVTINGEVCHTYPDSLSSLEKINAIKGYDCGMPMRGRYVHVQKKDVDGLTWWDRHMLVFCEFMIYACLPGTYWSETKCVKHTSSQSCKYYLDNYYGCTKLVEYNIAMNKTVDMSSVDFGTADSTVDGRTDSRLFKLECTASGTKDGQNFNPFWRVDLAGPHHVKSVVVKPRIDCCSSTMKNLNVLVQDRKVNLAHVIQHDPSELCKHWEGVFENGVQQEFKCSKTMLGTFVSLQTIRPSKLWLCEVRVMGYPVTVLGPGTSCDVNHVTTFCQAGLTCENSVCKVLVGKECGTRERKEHCVSETICDGGFCKLQPDASCKQQRDLCALGTECDSDAGYKCLKTVGEQCSTADDCAKKALGVTCDFLLRCGKELGVACAADKECVSGARCDSNRCRCVDGVSTPNGTMCAPEAGQANASCSTGTCTANAVCDATDTCQCTAQFEVFRVDLTCSYQKGQVGGACANHSDCGKAMVCQEQQCKRVPLERCKKDHECQAEAVCDFFTQLCMLKQGSSCVDTEGKTCMTGTTCYNALCYHKVGEACDTSNDTCIHTAECGTKAGHDDTLCLVRAGSDCSGDKSTLCKEGTTCNADSKCRIRLGGRCDDDRSSFCQLGSQCDNNECRLMYGSDCLNTKKCLNSLVCDSLNVCRIPAGGECSWKQDGCQAGATCTSNVCQCITTDCVPEPRKVGGTCTVPPNTAASVATQDTSHNVGQGRCDDRSAVCDRELAVCKCSSGSAPRLPDFTCGTGPGIACNKTFKCASNLVCDNSNVCAYHAGERCAAGQSWFCKTGTTCDVDGFCRYYQNEACSDAPTMCRLGTKCDAYTHRCMVPAGSECAIDEDCESGSNCRHLHCRCAVGLAKPALQGQGCDPHAGRVGGKCLTEGSGCKDKNAACSDAVCKCGQDYIVDSRDFTCKKKLGASCSGEGQCGTHAFCDSDSKCSLQYGEKCNGDDKVCPAGAICDSNRECRIKIHGTCSGVDTDNCESGTSCDWLQKCRLVVGQACNASQACPVGAVCVNDMCGCDNTTSTQHNLVCEPLPGRVGSDCDTVDRPCKVAGAECVAETCTCGAKAQPTQEFGCYSQGKTTKAGGLSIFGLIVGLLVGVGGAAALIAAVVYRRERKELDWVPEIRERRQSLADLTKLSETLEDSSGTLASDTSSQSETQTTQTATTLNSRREPDPQYDESISQYGDQSALKSQSEIDNTTAV